MFMELGRFYTWIKAVETPTAAHRQAADIEAKGGEKVENEEIVWQATEDKE